MNKRITKIFLIYTILTVCFSNSFAQNTENESLKRYMDSTTLFFEGHQFEKAYTYSIQAINIAEKLNLDSAIFDIRMEQGNIQRTLGMTKEALRAFDLATNSAINIKDTNKIVNSILAKGDCYMFMYNLDRIKPNYIDSASKYYNQTETLIIKAKLNELLADYHEVMGHIELYKKNYAKSEKLYDKSSSYHLSQNDSTTYFITLINNTNNYISTGRYVKAETSCLKAESYFKRNKQLSYLLTTYSTFVYLYETKKDYKKAFDYSKLETETDNKIKTVENNKNISELNTKYNLEKKENELLVIQNEKDKAELSKKKISYWLTLITVLLIALAVIFWLSVLRHRLKQKNLTLLHKEQELLQQSRLEQLESESQHKIINAALDGREEERKAIAETLHNSVSALLSSANLHLQAFKKNISEERHKQILKTQDIIVEASGKIRDLSHNLVSSLLINFGLEYAVHDICEKFTSTELEFMVDSNLEHRYPANTELKIYHIIEELCNNTLKHSKANRAQIKLHQSDNELKISIQDDGIGFDTDKLPKKSAGIGLSQIEARIKNMNGVFDIYSKPKNGTLITLVIPMIPIIEE